MRYKHRTLTGCELVRVARVFNLQSITRLLTDESAPSACSMALLLIAKVGQIPITGETSGANKICIELFSVVPRVYRNNLPTGIVNDVLPIQKTVHIVKRHSARIIGQQPAPLSANLLPLRLIASR